MTKEKLEQYLDLKKEIEQLEQQCEELSARKDRMVSDSVSGSMTEYPYTRRVVKIQGLDIVDRARRTRMLARAEEQRVEAERKVEEIDQWVASIEDSHVRRIIRFRFIRGMSWPDVARAMGGGNSEDGTRKAFDRFIQKS